MNIIASLANKLSTQRNQLAVSHDVPLIADNIESPIVHYGSPMTAIHFPSQDGNWGRVTFERLDSLKVSRGEFLPYSYLPENRDKYSWVTTVSDSAWLQERYEYEKQCYGSSYNFNGNVEEMLDEYSHYVFSFHDQFVEAIAAGIWFESHKSMLDDRRVDGSHPLMGLSDLEPSESFEAFGISCFVKNNPLKNEEIHLAGALCSQTILEVGVELDGRTSTSWTLTYRVRNGVGKSHLRNSFGNPVETYEGIPSFDEIRPRIHSWLEEVRERRRKMGKQ